MITVPRFWHTSAARRPRRTRPTARPLTEPLEPRAVLSASITANIGGLTPPVVSVTVPQPGGSGKQDVSLILTPSVADTQLFTDLLSGKILQKVSITRSDGEHGKDTIGLRDALISSYQSNQNRGKDEPSVAISIEGVTSRAGSIAANIDGVTPHVVSLTVSRPSASGEQNISLIVTLSKGVTNLFNDAATGKDIPEVDITLNRIGNASTDTIRLSKVLISSIQDVGAGDVPEVEINLAALHETIVKT